jgi:hypothetical protein
MPRCDVYFLAQTGLAPILPSFLSGVIFRYDFQKFRSRREQTGCLVAEIAEIRELDRPF